MNNIVNLLVNANFYPPTGFGKWSSKDIIHLAKLGINVKWQTGMGLRDLTFFSPKDQKTLWKTTSTILESPTIRMHICTPMPRMLKIDSNYDYNIAYTVSETETVAPEMVNACKPFDELWVPSKHVYNAFVKSGFPKDRIYLIPYGVDTELFNPIGETVEIFDGRFIFFAVSGWGIRKGWDLLIQAFSEEFADKDNVCLFIKTGNYSHDGPPQKIRNEITMYQKRYRCKSPIVVTTDIPNNQTMAILYRSADCFVLPTRAEGFGLPFLEAMSTELPTIFTDYSGMKDFANKKNAFPVKVNKLDVHPLSDNLYRYYKGHKFAYPNLKSLKEQMRYVYENYEKAKEKAKIARQDILQNWTWEKVCQKGADRLVEIAKKLYTERKIPIPIPKKPKLSIIVISGMVKTITQECIQRIMKYTTDYELIIVDNGSTDGTQDYLATLQQEVKIIYNAENKGAPFARNQGKQLATGDIIVYLDNDLYVGKGWDTKVLEAFKNSEVGILGAYTMASFIGLKIDYYCPVPKNEKMAPCDTVMSAFLAIRKEIDDKLEWDIGYEKYFREDCDYCLTARRLGCRAFYLSDLPIKHLCHKSINALFTKKELLQKMQQGNKYFSEKWKGKSLDLIGDKRGRGNGLLYMLGEPRNKK